MEPIKDGEREACIYRIYRHEHANKELSVSMHIQTNKMAINQKAEDLISRIEGLVPGCVVKDTAKYRSDWWVAYRIEEGIKGSPLAAVKPKCKDDLLKILKFAREEGIAILPRGGGSSVTGASVSNGGIVIDMSLMSSVVAIDAESRTVTVQAGARLESVEKSLNEKGFTLGQFPQSFELATIGGYISTMGTGHFSSFYGGIEESVLRLEVLLSNGELIKTREYGVPRSSAGPDLSKIFIGAEGAFGIITEAELKIHPIPKHTQALVYGFNTFEQAINAVKALNDIDIKPQLCRVYNETESSFYFGTGKSIVLLSYASNNPEVLSSTVSELSGLMLSSGGAQEDTKFLEKAMKSRFDFRSQLESFQKMGLEVETIEIASRWKDIGHMYKDLSESLSAIEDIAASGAHLSHIYPQGACTYFTIIFKPNLSSYQKIWEAAAAAARRNNSSVSHHHGVGILKSEYVKEEIPISLLSAIKRSLDPDGIISREARSNNMHAPRGSQ